MLQPDLKTMPRKFRQKNERYFSNLALTWHTTLKPTSHFCGNICFIWGKHILLCPTLYYCLNTFQILRSPTSQWQVKKVLRELVQTWYHIITWKDVNSLPVLECCWNCHHSNIHQGVFSPVSVSFGRQVSNYFFVHFLSLGGEGRPADPLKWEGLEFVVLGNSGWVKLTEDAHRT